VNKIMGRKKLLSSLGALMLMSTLPFSNALADTNTPTIPSDGQLDAPGQAYLDPAKAPYTVGSLTSTLNTQAFYQGNPYTDTNAVRNEVHWYHPNSSWVNDPTAKEGISMVSFGLATVSLEDGSGRTGNFYLYNIDTLSSNNGYGLISVDDVPAWVQMLGGDLQTIQQDMANGTLDASSYMDDGLSQWHVVHLGQLAKLCGWTLAFDNGTDANNIGDPMNGMYVPTDQTNAKPTFKLFPNQQKLTLSYHFGSDYSAQYNPDQPAPFTQGLTLTLNPNSVPKDLQAAPNDKFQFFYKVDDRDWMPLPLPADTVNVFDSTGKPKSTINISPDMLSVIPFRTWGANETHKILVKVTAAQGNTLSYNFSSQDSGTNQSEAVVTITFTSKAIEQKPPSVPKDWLDLRWGSNLPRQVNRLSNFSAPVVVSNNGSESKTTTLKFEMTGTFCVRHVDEDPTTGKETVTFRNYPITETAYKTVTVGPHSVVQLNFSDGMTYNVNYDGPTNGKNFYEEPLDGFTDLDQLAGSHTVTNQPLNSEAPGPVIVGYDKSGNPIYEQPTYAIYLKVTAQDPEDYIEPSIDTWIGVIGPNTVPPKSSVHLVQ
jgi:hypothetical protein